MSFDQGKELDQPVADGHGLALGGRVLPLGRAVQMGVADDQPLDADDVVVHWGRSRSGEGHAAGSEGKGAGVQAWRHRSFLQMVRERGGRNRAAPQQPTRNRRKRLKHISVLRALEDSRQPELLVERDLDKFDPTVAFLESLKAPLESSAHTAYTAWEIDDATATGRTASNSNVVRKRVEEERGRGSGRRC